MGVMLGLIILIFGLLTAMGLLCQPLISHVAEKSRPLVVRRRQPKEQDVGFAPLSSSRMSLRERNQLLMDWWEQDFEHAVKAVDARERCLKLQAAMIGLRDGTLIVDRFTEMETRENAVKALREWQALTRRTDAPTRYKYAKMGYAAMDRKAIEGVSRGTSR